MNIEDIKTVAVLGAGDMGHGIAEVALLAGYKVYLRDVSREFVDRGVARILESLDKLVKKGKAGAGLVARIKAELLVPVTDLAAAVRDADLVIEAIPEVMELKQETFSAADRAAPAHALLASNTSTMSITRIAQSTRRPSQVLGLHYFNPAVLMKTVEVIRGEGTAEETMRLGVEYCRRTGKVPVRVEKDVPGFIVNRVQAPTVVLLGAVLDRGEIAPEAVDAMLRKAGMPMGPYETMDYTGLDINFHASKYFSEAVHPDFAPGKIISEKVAKGELGKKTGRGIFDWSAGRPAIDLSKATSRLDPLDLIAVQVNEATKIIAAGACTKEDVDQAVVNGTGALIGPMALAKGLAPAELSRRLNALAERLGKEIFRPTRMIEEGAYK